MFYSRKGTVGRPELMFELRIQISLLLAAGCIQLIIKGRRLDMKLFGVDANNGPLYIVVSLYMGFYSQRGHPTHVALMHILDFEDIPATTYCIVIKLIAEACSQLHLSLLPSQGLLRQLELRTYNQVTAANGGPGKDAMGLRYRRYTAQPIR